MQREATRGPGEVGRAKTWEHEAGVGVVLSIAAVKGMEPAGRDLSGHPPFPVDSRCFKPLQVPSSPHDRLNKHMLGTIVCLALG